MARKRKDDLEEHAKVKRNVSDKSFCNLTILIQETSAATTTQNRQSRTYSLKSCADKKSLSGYV